MKCVALHQPWASLIAIGAKQYETRSWPTKHRGPIAIHAAKRWTQQLARIAKSWPFRDVLERAGHDPDTMFLGKLVATADLVDCIKLVPGFEHDDRMARRLSTSHERDFGDWSVGRYVWKLENVVALTSPQAIRGYQGIFEIDDKHIAAGMVPTTVPAARSTLWQP